MSSTNRRTVNRGRKSTLWIVAAIVALLLFVIVWISLRALMAREELLGAIPLANRIGSQVLAGEEDLAADVEDLQRRATAAARLTSDPVWRAAEWVPVLGGNLTAFRESASMIDELARDALPPLAELAATFNVDSLSPQDGAFNLEVFTAAQPMLGEARDALDNADARAVSIDTENTIAQIGVAVDEVAGVVRKAKTAIDGIDTAASLLPSMLGAEGSRSYLLLSLNNSELRATGGLPGAVAVLNADEGKIALGELSSATALGEFEIPVLELTESEKTLYGDLLGTYMQDVNYTPNFARSGELAREMWRERTGQTVDGVLAVDPVALGYILRATGPVEAGSGITLTADNATDVLLSGVYNTIEGPDKQDSFFAGVTSQIFGAVTSGAADTAELMTALSLGASENRIHLWSADSAEQEKISSTSIAGAVPKSTDANTAFGVYFNDATGGKMDYYLSGGIGIASAVCRNDGRPNFDVRVKLESRAPADASSSLPPYVTGGGVYGVAPGNISTSVFVYAPEGSVPYSVTIDGQEYAFVSADDSGHSVAGVTVELTPGQQTEISMKFVGLAGAPDSVVLQHTPLATEVLTSLDNYLDCNGVSPAPVEGEDEQSGALPMVSTILPSENASMG
jgi:hypothetical protein